MISVPNSASKTKRDVKSAAKLTAGVAYEESKNTVADDADTKPGKFCLQWFSQTKSFLGLETQKT